MFKVGSCMAAGLVKGEGFAVDASVMEANASRYHGKARDEFHLAAIVQSLKTLALRILGPPRRLTRTLAATAA